MKDRIKELRKVLGLNQTEFGQKLELDQTTISGYEKGIREPSDLVIRTICQQFGVSRAWLVDGVGEMMEATEPTTMEEEIAEYLGDVLRPMGDTFQKRFIAMLAKLSEDDWKLIEKMTYTIMEESGHRDFMNEKKPDGK